MLDAAFRSSRARRVVITTEHARLTTWLASDLEELAALHAEPATMRYMRSGVESQEQVARRLNRYLQEQDQRGWTRWRVEDETGRLIGRAGFELTEEHGRRHRELGYLLAPAVWGKRLASELARDLVAWHRAHPDPLLDDELIAYSFPDNTASRRILEKMGFAVTGEDTLDGHRLVRYAVS